MTDRTETVPGSVGAKAESRARLTFRGDAGYGLGVRASNLYFQTFVLFLPIFYTDVFGISAAAMGTMMLVTRIWDAVTDPLMGVVADRTQTRWGKFRPYIAGFAFPWLSPVYSPLQLRVLAPQANWFTPTSPICC